MFPLFPSSAFSARNRHASTNASKISPLAIFYISSERASVRGRAREGEPGREQRGSREEAERKDKGKDNETNLGEAFIRLVKLQNSY